MTEWTSKAIGWGRTFVNTVLTAFKTAPGGALVVGGKLRLSQDPAFNPTPSSAIADLTPNEATFSGYPAGGAAVVLTSPVNLSGVCQGVLFSFEFVGSGGPFVANQIYGYWIDDGTNVIAFEKFGAAGFADFNVAGAFLTLNVELPYQLSQPTS